jgi:hypothetical protein
MVHIPMRSNAGCGVGYRLDASCSTRIRNRAVASASFVKAEPPYTANLPCTFTFERSPRARTQAERTEGETLAVRPGHL